MSVCIAEEEDERRLDAGLTDSVTLATPASELAALRFAATVDVDGLEALVMKIVNG